MINKFKIKKRDMFKQLESKNICSVVDRDEYLIYDKPYSIPNAKSILDGYTFYQLENIKETKKTIFVELSNIIATNIRKYWNVYVFTLYINKCGCILKYLQEKLQNNKDNGEPKIFDNIDGVINNFLFNKLPLLICYERLDSDVNDLFTKMLTWFDIEYKKLLNDSNEIDINENQLNFINLKNYKLLLRTINKLIMGNEKTNDEEFDFKNLLHFIKCHLHFSLQENELLTNKDITYNSMFTIISIKYKDLNDVLDKFIYASNCLDKQYNEYIQGVVNS